jgi:hypothetical protein
MHRVNGVEHQPDVYIKRPSSILECAMWRGGLYNLISSDKIARFTEREIRFGTIFLYSKSNREQA